MSLIYIEEGELKSKSSCELCAMVSSCKFYAKVKELFKTNEFYEMTYYSESNNNLRAWADNRRCQFYVPYLYNKSLFEKELKKERTSINQFDWYKIVFEYFKEKYYSKYESYFKEVLAKQKERDIHKGTSDEQLIPYCVKRLSSKFIYTIRANDDSWEEVIPLIDVLEHYKAFK